jgi:subfamily B ATP-binding cassette protein MsbA
MFLPLLQMVNSNAAGGEILNMGKLSFIVKGLQSTGYELNLVSVLLFMVIFFVFKGIAKYYSSFYRVTSQQLMVKRVRIKMLNAFNVINFKDFVTEDVGRIQNAMTGEIDKLTRAFSMYFSTFEQVIFLFVYVVFALMVDFKFALLVTLGGAFTNLIYNYFYKLTKYSSKKLSLRSNVYQGQIVQHVANFKYLRATATVSVFAEKLRQTIFNLERFRLKIGKYGAFLQALREPLMIIIISTVIIIQSKFLGGNLESILISLLFFYRALSSLTFMQQNWNRFLADSGSLYNVKSFQNKINNSREKNGTIDFGKLQHGISLVDVSFNFESTPILRNISLDISKKESIAFVGESGSGKTTLINIITGLYKIDHGEMLIDGTNIDQLKKETFQKRIGYVTQEAVIFNDTIFNNITLWAEPSQANLDKFNKVIAQTSLSTFLMDLPEKEDTVLGNAGLNISGGQRQRISIARELFKDIDILILDEATSALDSETEKFIQESIESLRGKLMLIIVAHRLSTIKNVDKIALLNKGRMMDIGSFEDLKEKNLLFKKMTEMQVIASN